jgi:hypothetical protein
MKSLTFLVGVSVRKLTGSAGGGTRVGTGVGTGVAGGFSLGLFTGGRFWRGGTLKVACVLTSVVVLTVLPGSAEAGETAYTAMRVACTGQGRDAQNRILEVKGVEGRPQPGDWKVWLEDGRGQLLEIEVSGQRVVGKRAAGGRPSAPKLNLSAIQLDSDGVFSIVNDEAVRAGVTFDRLNYALNASGGSGLPMWTVELLDGPGRRVGMIRIAADNAFILERSPEMALSEQEKRARRWSRPGEPLRSVPDAFHRFGLFSRSTGYKFKNWVNGYGWTDEKEPAVPSY